MTVLRVSASSAWKWIEDLGLPGLVLVGIWDNAPFLSAPGGTIDAMVIMLSWHHRGWWAYYALMATVGEVIGGYLSYRAFEKGGAMALEKKFGKARTEQVYRWFDKRGTGFMVCIGAILPPPFPYTPVLAAAGVGHYPRDKFLQALTGGRSIRFLLEAYLGRRYGQAVIDFFKRYYRPALHALIALAILGGISAFIYFKWYRPREKRKSSKKAAAPGAAASQPATGASTSQSGAQAPAGAQAPGPAASAQAAKAGASPSSASPRSNA